jgi:hypothetical protein
VRNAIWPGPPRMEDPSSESESVWRLLKMPADSPLRNRGERNVGALDIHLRAGRWRGAFGRMHAVAQLYGYPGGEDFFEANGFYW